MTKIDLNILTLGLLEESDIISLSDYLRVEGKFLIDDANGAKHELHPRVVFLVKKLNGKIPYLEWIKLAKKRKVKIREAGKFLLFLNSIGGLKIQRSLKDNLKMMFRINRCKHIRRQRLNKLTILLSILRASYLFAILVPATTILLFRLGVNFSDSVSYPTIIYLIFLFSTLAHEYTHSYFSTNTAVVLQKGMNIGIITYQNNSRIVLKSAFLGPLIGAFTALLLGMLFQLIDKGLFQISLILALAQLWSLAPWYGDGKKINQIIFKGDKLSWKFLREMIGNISF